MAAKQRDKRAHNRARSKQLKEKAEAQEAAAVAAASATATAAVAVAVPPSAAATVATAVIAASPPTATAEAAASTASADPKDPAHWEAVDTTHGNKHLVQLTKEKHSAELAGVEQHWKQTQGQGRIVSVHRIQSNALHHRFEGMRRNTPGLSEQVAYHGTRTNVPALIYDSPTGFDMSRGTARPGYLWFAQLAQYSSSAYWHPVTQATLPFGQSAMVYDPVTFTYTAPFKQLMRMRLLLNNAEAAQWTAGVVLVNQSDRCLPEYLITFQ